MAKAPKTVEGLRTALRELIPAQVETHSIVLHAWYDDGDSHSTQHSYASFSARIEVQYGDTKLNVKADASTPARLIIDVQRELRIAAARARQQHELTLAAPRLEHSRKGA